MEDLEEKIKEIRSNLEKRQQSTNNVIQPMIFRGHASSDWKLETTLERHNKKKYSIDLYNRILLSIHHEVSSYTGKKWSLDKRYEYGGMPFEIIPNHVFMTYARHHGFPTPILDWTRSLYVALFFAYQNASEDKDVALYAYIESLNGFTEGTLGAPRIAVLGPTITTHKRHFTQQAQYTVAVKNVDRNWVYCPHDEGFEESSGKLQDVLWKFTLPGSIKNEVLGKLQEMNINAFTLFASEESLMETLAQRELR